MPKVYLLSRTMDPILGVFTGVLAYHLSEGNPRSNIPVGHTLRELIPWQLDQWKMERKAKETLNLGGTSIGQSAVKGQELGEVEWDRLRRELEGEKSKSV